VAAVLADLRSAPPAATISGRPAREHAYLNGAQLNIGVQSDPDGLPDLDVFADGLRRSLEELGAATSPPMG
jgi:hypothetical protein